MTDNNAGKAAPVHPRLTPRQTPSSDIDLIQSFIARNGATKPTSKQGLPCANVNIAAGLNSLKTFTQAALSAGIITKEELTNV
jgi:hypothetical protein